MKKAMGSVCSLTSIYKTLISFLMIVFSAAIAAASISNDANIRLIKSGDWSAFVSSSKPKDCFVVGMPFGKAPAHLNHGDVLFFVVTRPAAGVINEPSIQVEYDFQAKSDVIISVDGKEFFLFTRGDTAWLETIPEEAQLIKALKRGKEATIKATSARGNDVEYKFSLMGITSALRVATSECKKK